MYTKILTKTTGIKIKYNNFKVACFTISNLFAGAFDLAPTKPQEVCFFEELALGIGMTNGADIANNSQIKSIGRAMKAGTGPKFSNCNRAIRAKITFTKDTIINTVQATMTMNLRF